MAYCNALLAERTYTLHGKQVCEACYLEHEDTANHCPLCAEVDTCWCPDCWPAVAQRKRELAAA